MLFDDCRIRTVVRSRFLNRSGGLQSQSGAGSGRCYSDLMAFCLWLELILNLEGPNSEIVSTELDHRYNGFSVPIQADGKAIIRALNKWVIAHALNAGRDAGIVAALAFHVRYHPEYAAMLSYARHCHGLLRDHRFCHPAI